MPIAIDPKVDFVFKLLLGDPRQKELLIDFLNAVLQLPEPVAEVKIENPYNEKQFDEDKLSVVDVLATDARGARFQVEIQLELHRALRERMLFGWASVHVGQLHEGEDFELLQPTYAIWLLNDKLFRASPHHHHRFVAYDPERHVQLSPQLNIHVLELPKWVFPESAELTPEQRWLYFFKEAERWHTLPPELDGPTMRQAMSVLDDVRQRQEDLARYRARQEGIRVQKAIEAGGGIEQLRLERAERLLELKDEQIEERRQRLMQKDHQLEQKDHQLEQKDHQLEQKDHQLEQKDQVLAALRQRLLDAGLDPDLP